MALAQRREPFDQTDWLFELKWDGFRTLAHITGRASKLFSRKVPCDQNESIGAASGPATACRSRGVLGRSSYPSVMRQHEEFAQVLDSPWPMVGCAGSVDGDNAAA